MASSPLTRGLVRGTALASSAGLGACLFLLPSASADATKCGDLIICVDVTVPGGTTGGSTGGGSGNGSGSNSQGGTGGTPSTEYPDASEGGQNGIDGGGPGAPGDPVIDTPPLPTPAEVAAVGLAQLELRRPKVFMTPKEGKLGLVGLPVWLWIDASDPQRWSPGGIHREVTVRTVTVTVWAYSPSVTWNMGDGTTVECYTSGEPYDPSYGEKESTCGHKYNKTSMGKPNDKFTVTATVNWKSYYVDATGRHDLPNLVGTTETTARVGELQVIN